MPKYVKPGGDRYRAYKEDRFYWGQMLEFSDWEIVSLICPRAFMVEAGRKDAAAYWEMTLDELNLAKSVYEKLGISDRCEICIHDGGHIFRCVRVSGVSEAVDLITDLRKSVILLNMKNRSS